MSYYQMMVYGSSSTPIKVQLKKPQSTFAKHKIIRIFRNLAEHMHVTFNNLHDQKSDNLVNLVNQSIQKWQYLYAYPESYSGPKWRAWAGLFQQASWSG